MALEQKILSAEQVEAFHHDLFVEDQARDFAHLLPEFSNGAVVDVGGGCGFFANRLARATGRPVRVLDMDVASIDACRRIGVEASLGDALAPQPAGDEEVACFNLILHHLVGDSESATRELQRRALRAWRNQVSFVFVNEYIYESFVGNVSGWLIYQIARSHVLSWLGSQVSRLVPAFRANTFGVGVRFRAHDEWKRLFEEAGFDVSAEILGEEEDVSPPLRLLFIRKIRRDSFLLRPRVDA